MKSIKAENKVKPISKELFDLFEAIKIATKDGPINNRWDEDLVTQVVEIFETHPVRHPMSFHLNESIFS